MKTIISTIQPFVLEQKIYLFENRNLEMTIGVTLRDLPEAVLKACESNHVANVTLQGPIDFTSQIKEEIQTLELTQYGNNHINITLA